MPQKETFTSRKAGYKREGQKYNQFFSWICGFHKKAKIIGPPKVITQFQTFLSDISERYNEQQPEG